MHDGLVMQLEDKLSGTNYYDEILLFHEYCRNGLAGEIDLLAIADRVWDFYEVKCNYHYKARKKATEQYKRFRTAFKKHEINGFLYTSDGVIRRL